MVRPMSDAAVETASLVNRMITESRRRLENHPVNVKRRAEGKLPANSLWPWSPGKRPRMETFESMYGVKGAVISAVDLIKGLAVYAGMDVISVEGATGLYDTNYEGKADACLEALKSHDFVYVHVEAPDEAGTTGTSTSKSSASRTSTGGWFSASSKALIKRKSGRWWPFCPTIPRRSHSASTRATPFPWPCAGPA